MNIYRSIFNSHDIWDGGQRLDHIHEQLQELATDYADEFNEDVSFFVDYDGEFGNAAVTQVICICENMADEYDLFGMLEKFKAGELEPGSEDEELRWHIDLVGGTAELAAEMIDNKLWEFEEYSSPDDNNHARDALEDMCARIRRDISNSTNDTSGLEAALKLLDDYREWLD